MEGNYTALIIPSALIVLGWIITHHLSARRDLANRRREQRVKYLIETYRVFVRAMDREGNLTEISDELQVALADLQFLGNEEQMKAARTVALTLAATSRLYTAELLLAIRKELRREMGRSPEDLSIRFPVIRSR
jgi:hypothetical protein